MSFVGVSQLSSGLRFSSTRGRTNGGNTQGFNYPSPFYDLAQTYLPTSFKRMMSECRYFFFTHPLINATVFKLSEYPITELVIDNGAKSTCKLWSEYLQDHHRYRAFQVEVGLDYNVYGNALVGINFPFVKYLTCPKCGFFEQAARIQDKWSFTNMQFRLTCPKCGDTVDADASDSYIKDPNGIRLVRWNPEDVEISFNELTQKPTYFYNIPRTLRSDIVVGKKDVVAHIPQLFLKAIKQQKSVVFADNMLFHLRRPSISGYDKGWGMPLLLPVLKDAFYMQIMKKAQEAILLEHIVPLRILFPQAGSGSSDPYTTINLDQWRDHVAQEIARWRYDNNYIPIMPLPIGQQTVGGDGRALLLTQEMQMYGENLLNGMTVPREFIMGGLSYSGTNVSMRMLENSFIGYRLYHQQLLRFVISNIATFLKWPVVHGRFKPFKMADDIQRTNLIMQANAAGKVSDTTFLSQLDLSQEEEDHMMVSETAARLEATEKQQLAMASTQGKAQVIMTKFQAKAQQAMQQASQQPQAPGEPGGPDALRSGAPGGQGQAADGEGAAQENAAGTDPMQQTQSQLSVRNDMSQAGMQTDMRSWALTQAQLLAKMPPDQQQIALQNLEQQNADLAALVRQLLAQIGKGQQGASTDMRPLPDKLPPRRSAQVV